MLQMLVIRGQRNFFVVHAHHMIMGRTAAVMAQTSLSGNVCIAAVLPAFFALAPHTCAISVIKGGSNNQAYASHHAKLVHHTHARFKLRILTMAKSSAWGVHCAALKMTFETHAAFYRLSAQSKQLQILACFALTKYDIVKTITRAQLTFFERQNST